MQRKPRSFFERPAVDVAPTRPSAPGETALVGRTVSHYQVLSLLGAGGMGEVYLTQTRDWIELSP